MIEIVYRCKVGHEHLYAPHIDNVETHRICPECKKDSVAIATPHELLTLDGMPGNMLL